MEMKGKKKLKLVAVVLAISLVTGTWMASGETVLAENTETESSIAGNETEIIVSDAEDADLSSDQGVTLLTTEDASDLPLAGAESTGVESAEIESLSEDTDENVSEPEETLRYTVLILDASSSMSGTPASVQREAAIKFCESLISTEGTNYIAIVKLASTSSVGVNFTTDIDTLEDYISSFPANSNTNTNQALEVAGDLLANIEDSGNENIIKNIVLCSDGLPQSGSTTSDGPYTSSDYSTYRYANFAYNTATELKENYTIYTLGFFHSLSGSALTFAQKFMKDLATDEDKYYEVTDVDDLVFMFGELAGDLATIDTDGDGLPDDWEINGVDTDGDGVIDIHLELMGADPNVPDIFVEVDWMVRPEKKFLIFTIQKELSYAPSETALRMVYESFKAQGINLHIDAGPDSVDFVTGNTWGSLSGGGTVAYESNFDLGTNYEHWNDTVEANFAESRESVFRYCLFVNKYGGTNSTGIANDIPGQYFIVAKGSTGDNNTSVAGTFMHELGHTIGLSHGGFDHNGNNNHDNYKPNYLSIMNYSFQLSGLVGTNGIDYSRYTLPDLDETNLSEADGIDRAGLTAGSGLGTKINSSFIYNIAYSMIDYNSNNIIENNLSLDLNNSSSLSVLTGTNDWDNIVYTGGNIGKTSYNTFFLRGVEVPDEETLEALTELTYDTALEYGLLGNEGSGEFEALGPYTLATGLNGQKVYVRVINNSPIETSFKLHVEDSAITSDETIDITLDGSVSELSYIDVPISINNVDSDGEYTTGITLSYEDSVVYEDNITVELCSFSEEEIEALEELIADDTVDIPDIVRNEYDSIYSQLIDDSNIGRGDDASGENSNIIVSEVDNGTIVVTPDDADSGDTVTITVIPDAGYVLSDLSVTDENGNELALTDNGDGTYTFIMPEGDVTVSAKFVEKSQAVSDIKPSDNGDTGTNTIATNSNNASNSKDTVATGDNSDIWLWLVTVFASGIVIVTFILINRTKSIK